MVRNLSCFSRRPVLFPSPTPHGSQSPPGVAGCLGGTAGITVLGKLRQEDHKFGATLAT